MALPIYCPSGCGSTTFRASRKGILVEDIEVDAETGHIRTTGKLAEGGGHLYLACECGRSWRTSRALDLARFLEES